MKPAWDKLMQTWNESPEGKTSLVADVDCTAAGKSLCDEVGVRGFPTIKFGDPSNLEDYKGGRDYDSLHKFAKENLKPVCSPSNIDLCDAEQKGKIEALQALSASDLKAKISEKEKEMEQAEQDFKDGVEGLQKQYKEMMEKKDAKLAEIKESGLGLMKAVAANAAKKQEEL